jgi:hypothetical protein
LDRHAALHLLPLLLRGPWPGGSEQQRIGGRRHACCCHWIGLLVLLLLR